MNFVIDSCKHDPNRWNFCKNCNGEGNIDDVKSNMIRPVKGRINKRKLWKSRSLLPQSLLPNQRMF